MKSVTTAIAATLAIACMAQAHAASVYKGLFTDGQSRVLMILQLEPSAKPGERAGQLRMAEPWMCQLQLRATDGDGQARRYVFAGVGAGRCDRLSQGHLSVEVDGDNAAVRVFDAKGAERYSADLIEIRS
ncbi:hypothetical protein [uncultured Pseudomonas sp.]|uniref:hypothetical protein n=1 Tax=uncultured Pseudomonas sp. TaxID=114707 RepID=UPI0025F4A816|nr:hypothetical protein [uncultured Pseudomonas sp.]